jgi:RNA polymerase sigma-70 factor (ECF subfamily)
VLISSSQAPRGAGDEQDRTADLRVLKLQLGWSPETARLHELAHLVAAGDATAFAELYDVTSARVYGTVRRVLRSAHLAAEVTQEVYVEIWQKAVNYDPERGTVCAWMITMAHRRAVDRVRAITSDNVRDERYAALNNDREFDQVWDEVEGRMNTARVRAALATLSDVQRQVLTLAYFDGYSQSQVARLLNVPLGTVKTRTRDGLNGLREALRMWT